MVQTWQTPLSFRQEPSSNTLPNFVPASWNRLLPKWNGTCAFASSPSSKQPEFHARISPLCSGTFAADYASLISRNHAGAGSTYYDTVMTKRSFVLALLLASPGMALTQTSSPSPGTSANEQQPTGLLSPTLTEKLLPSSVLYKGQQAPVQGRNSGAIRYADGALVIASLVDSSGYSTGVREKYQFFLYTEKTLRFGDKTLTPGFYGAGFLANNTLIITDVSGKDLISAPTTNDASFKRPRPLQIIAAPDSTSFRLYLGRSFVTLPSIN